MLYFGISDAPGNGSALEEIYRSTADAGVKKAVLHPPVPLARERRRAGGGGETRP